jgi:Transposase DDE domain
LLHSHVKVEAANESDANALIPAIEDTVKRGLAPQELLADSLYGSDDNVEKAKELGVELVSPVMGSQANKISLSEFKFSGSDEIIACPEGQKSQRIKTGKQGGKIVRFNKAVCDLCPRQKGLMLGCICFNFSAIDTDLIAVQKSFFHLKL